MLSVVFLLVGCSNTKDNNAENIPSVSDTIENDTETGAYSQSLSNTADSVNGIYSIENNIWSEDSVNIAISSDNGDKYYSLLSFTDKSVNKKVVLCNKPDCNHTDSSCTAYFPSYVSVLQDSEDVRFAIMDSEGYVFLYDNKLYVLNPFGDLIVMNRDGTNHKKLISIDSKYFILNGFLYKDSVFLCVKYLPDFDGNSEQEFSDEDYNMALLRLNLSDGKYKELFSCKQEQETNCLGIYDNKAYFFFRSPNTLSSAKTQQEVDSEENGHDVCLYSFDILFEKRMDIIKDIKSYEFDNIVFDKNTVFYSNRKEKKIIGLDLDTNIKKEIVLDIDGYVELQSPIKDNKLYYIKNKELTNAFSSTKQQNETYYVELNSGKVSKIN